MQRQRGNVSGGPAFIVLILHLQVGTFSTLTGEHDDGRVLVVVREGSGEGFVESLVLF